MIVHPMFIENFDINKLKQWYNMHTYFIDKNDRTSFLKLSFQPRLFVALKSIQFLLLVLTARWYTRDLAVVQWFENIGNLLSFLRLVTKVVG